MLPAARIAHPLRQVEHLHPLVVVADAGGSDRRQNIFRDYVIGWTVLLGQHIRALQCWAAILRQHWATSAFGLNWRVKNMPAARRVVGPGGCRDLPACWGLIAVFADNGRSLRRPCCG